ncbi:MAG: hypothetical protein LBU81_02915 [Methanosarcinales archaeon]|nr:hypothetical protein [Methanosarcinales archaeon]
MVSSKYNNAIHTEGDNSSVTIEGGTVSAGGNGNAIDTERSGSSVTINGGVVSATNGNAVNSTGTITVNDGFLFAYGTAASDVTNKPPSALSSPGIIVSWDQKQNKTIYVENCPGPDLNVLPAEASVVWHEDPNEGGGISYSNGANAGFFPMPVVVTNDFGLIFDSDTGKMY